MSLRLNQILGGADIRSPIFYDSDNTSYYLNPNSASNLNNVTVAGTLTLSNIAKNSTAPIVINSGQSASLGLRVYYDMNLYNTLVFTDSAWNGQGSIFGSSGVVTINAATATTSFVKYAGYSQEGGSFRAPIFYDSDNTAYYINPASNSIVNSLTFDSNITIYKHNDRNLLIQGGGGTDAGLLGRGSSGQFAFQVYGSGSGSYGFLDGAWAGWDIRKVVDGDLFLNDNNTYYLNPGSTTNLNNLTVAGTMTFGTLAYTTGSRRSKNSSNVNIETVTGLVSPSGPTFLELRGFCPPTMYRTTEDRPAPYGLGFGNGLESGGIMPIGSGDNLQEIMLYGANSGPTTFTFKRQIYEGTTYDPSASNYYGSAVFSINTGTGAVTASTDIRSPIFYDSNDTTYYIDAASTSQLNQVASYYLRNLAAVSTDHQFGLYFNNSIDTAYAIYREGGAWTNPYPDLRIAFHTGIKIGANAGYNGIRFYDDYGMANQVMSVNNSGDGLGANNVYVNNSLQAGSSLRAPIFYDSDNTGYYLNPASTTNLNDLYLDGDLRMNGSDSYIWMPNNNSYSTGFYDPVTGLTPLQLSGPSDGIYIGNTMWISYNKANNNSYNENIRLFNANNSVSVIAFSSTGISGTPTTSILGYSDRFETRVSDQWQQRIYSGYVEAYGSFRAPIFYDSNNTSYYTDPASTSVLNRIDLPSGSAAINTTTPGQTVYQLNFTGQSTVDNAQAITWGWSTSGAQAGIYVQSSGAYGTKMYIATTDSFATGSKTAITIDHTGIVTTNRNYLQAAGSLRAPIFYDSDNTAYYLDPVGTSRLTNLNVNEYYAIGWFRNSSSGNGLYNESSTQHFYSDDVSYWNVASSANAQGIRLRTGGYNGAIRGYFYANNNNDVGLLNNGGNWRVRVVGGDYVLFDGSSARAQVFYDSNDTTYYTDPAGTSYLNYSIFNGLSSSDYTRQFAPSGGYFYAGGAQTGAIKIRMPANSKTLYPMLSFTCHIYNYSTGTSRTFKIGGHFSNSSWYNTFAYCLSESAGNLNVRWGYEGNYLVVWIGETTSGWSYPCVFITDFQNGYSAINNSWMTGWNVSLVTAFDTVTNGPTAAGFFWNQNNDGSGSGLDADLVDGLDVHAGRNDNANKIVRTDSNGYIQAGWINTTSGDNGTTALDRIYASSDAYIRYYTPANFRTVLDVPTRAGSGASGSWGISITGNAATVSNGVYTNVNNTLTGINYFTSNLGTTSGSLSNPPLQAYASGTNAAFMSFHRGGSYAVNMGLDSDNVLRIGGWSASANRLQLDMSGNLTLAGVVDATQFRDSSNTAYYIDPASTSNLVGLTVANTITGAVSGNAGSVTINYNNDSNSTYQMLWGSGNNVYGTAGVYLNPSTDYVTATSFNASDWFRSSGATGWYNSTYGGGIYMTDTTWVRTYNSKYFYCDTIIQAGSDMRSPVYYDANDTAYYVDAASTSNLLLVKTRNTFGERVAVSATASTTINTQYNVTELTLAATITTLTLSNIQASGTVHMWTIVTVGGGVGYSITWPAAVKWPGGTAPTLTTTSNKRDIYQFVTYDGGTTIFAIIVGQNL